MGTRKSDTHPDAERVQIQLLRAASGTERFQTVRSITATTRQLAWRAIKSANPDASDGEVDMLFVSVHYGEELADKLRTYLAART